MSRLARYQWYRRLCGGYWLHSLSCGWFPVTDVQIEEYLREMPRYITGIEDNRNDALLYGILAGVGVASWVLSVGLLCGAIPW